jgi:hypothetical protein
MTAFLIELRSLSSFPGQFPGEYVHILLLRKSITSTFDQILRNLPCPGSFVYSELYIFLALSMFPFIIEFTHSSLRESKVWYSYDDLRYDKFIVYTEILTGMCI